MSRSGRITRIWLITLLVSFVLAVGAGAQTTAKPDTCKAKKTETVKAKKVKPAPKQVETQKKDQEKPKK
ncbi:hypothetical protein LLH00_19105 [bacterium]|nr:hypothetical protein [bacterium]